MTKAYLPIKDVLDSLGEAITELVEKQCIANRRDPILSVRMSIPILRFRKEYCTIKLSLPRRRGNTSLAMALMSHYKDSLFVTHSRDAASNLRQDLKKKFQDRILSVNSSLLRGTECRVVIVDGASWMSERQLDNVYKVNANFFILIG